MSFIVTYSGITDRSVGCHAKSRPSVPAPSRKIATKNLDGRDGSYYDTDNMFDDIVIPITFSFSEKDRDQWHSVYRRIKAWLLSGDNGNLRFSDDDGFYYRVRNVEITSSERISYTIGEVEARFVCEGYTYLESGDEIIQFSDKIRNDYSVSHPIYQIFGSGLCELEVNGKTMTMTINGNITIDTDKMIAFQDDATWVNTTVSGDYEDLWLKPGWNLLDITSGFTCRITPQWRCL